MAGSKIGYDELLQQMRFGIVLGDSIAIIAEAREKKSIAVIRAELQSKMHDDTFSNLHLPTLREDNEDFESIAEFYSMLENEYQACMNMATRTIDELAEKHHFSQAEMDDMQATLNHVLPAPGKIPTDETDADLKKLFASEEILSRTADVLEHSPTSSAQCLRAQLQASLSIADVCSHIDHSLLKTVMESDAGEDTIEDIKPVMKSEISASLARTKSRQQECIQKLQLNTHSVELIQCQASSWLTSIEIDTLKAKCADASTPSSDADMQALQERLARADRRVVLKKRRLDAEQTSMVTSSVPVSQTSDASSRTSTTVPAPRLLSASSFGHQAAMSPPGRSDAHGSPDLLPYKPIGDIIRDKSMKAKTKGVVVAQTDATVPNGIPKRVILLAWGNVCAPLIVWRDQAEHVARVAEASMDKVICLDKVRYTTFKGENQLEMLRDSQITTSSEEPPIISFPWMAFTSIPIVEDYQRVHLCGIVSDVGDMTRTQIGDPRLSLRIKDHSNNVIDVVAWRQYADESLWISGSKVEIFFGTVNRDRCCVEVGQETKIRWTKMPVQMFPSSGALHMIQWTPYKRTKRSHGQ